MCLQAESEVHFPPFPPAHPSFPPQGSIMTSCPISRCGETAIGLEGRETHVGLPVTASERVARLFRRGRERRAGVCVYNHMATPHFFYPKFLSHSLKLAIHLMLFSIHFRPQVPLVPLKGHSPFKQTNRVTRGLLHLFRNSPPPPFPSMPCSCLLPPLSPNFPSA
jgi:hypothetical protein